MEKILVVEDAQSIREEICDILQMEGFEVKKASNGYEGLIQTKNEKPDLVISDIMMPELNGYQMADEIKKYPPTNNIPIIFLSAKAQPEDIRKGMNLGVEDYITKPIHPNDLLTAVNKSLEKQKKINKYIRKLSLRPIELLPQDLDDSINVILAYSNYLHGEKSDIPKNELELLVNGIYNHGEKINKIINDYLLYLNLITKQSLSNIPDDNSLNLDHLYIMNIVSTIAEQLNRKNDVIFDLQKAGFRFNDFYFQKIIEEIIRCISQLSLPGSIIYVRSVVQNNMYCLSFEGELYKNKDSENENNLSSCKKSIEIIELIAKNYSGDFKFNCNQDTTYQFSYDFKLD